MSIYQHRDDILCSSGITFGKGLHEGSLYVKAYSYRAEGDKIVPEDEIWIPVCDAKKLAPGVPYWTDMAYASLPSSEGLNLTVKIRYADGGEEIFTPAYKNVPSEGFWHLGILLTENLNLVFLIGDEQQYVMSEAL